MGCGMRCARKPALTPLAATRKTNKQIRRVLTQQIHKQETDLQRLNHLGRRVQRNIGAIYIYICIYIVMYGCESWTIKKAERQRIDAFELGVEEDS